MSKLLYTTLILALSLNAEMTTRTKVLMGTFVSISLEQSDKRYFKGLYERLRLVDFSLSSYKPTAPIYLLNQNKTATINLYTYEALRLSELYYKRSDGYFDIAIGSVTKDLYKFGDEERVPNAQELKNANTSLESLVFTPKKASISKGTKIDLGGMGKGFGVDIARDYLVTRNISKAVIALSGDIRCLGECSISVKNPFAKEPLTTFMTSKKEMGISTSGNYNRYVKDTKNNHLINPKTKHSQDKFVSITLISELASSDLDAYATAASVMPKEKAYDFLNSLELAYIIVQVDKSLVVSENIAEYTNDLVFSQWRK